MRDIEAAQVPVPEAVMNALADDLNTPQAMAELIAMMKAENSSALKGALLAAGDVLGILQSDPAVWLAEETSQDFDALLAEPRAGQGG